MENRQICVFPILVIKVQQLHSAGDCNVYTRCKKPTIIERWLATCSQDSMGFLKLRPLQCISFYHLATNNPIKLVLALWLMLNAKHFQIEKYNENFRFCLEIVPISTCS